LASTSHLAPEPQIAKTAAATLTFRNAKKPVASGPLCSLAGWVQTHRVLREALVAPASTRRFASRASESCNKKLRNARKPVASGPLCSLAEWAHTHRAQGSSCGPRVHETNASRAWEHPAQPMALTRRPEVPHLGSTSNPPARGLCIRSEAQNSQTTGHQGRQQHDARCSACWRRCRRRGSVGVVGRVGRVGRVGQVQHVQQFGKAHVT